MKLPISAFKAMIVSSFIFAAAMISNLAHAGEFLFHGTNCASANLLQGQKLTWNKDGLTNNAAAHRFVICPITVDQDDWDASPNVNIEVDMWMQPGYTSAADGSITGPQCFFRFGDNDGNFTSTSDDQTFTVNHAFTIGSFDGTATEGDFDSSATSQDVDSGTDRHLHVLCLIPPGGTLISYQARQQ